MAQVTGGAWVVEVVIDGRAIGGWSEYSVRTSMLDPADSFTLSRLPFDRDAWDLCQTDRPIRITINGVVVLTGFIDSRKFRREGRRAASPAATKVGRLVQVGAPDPFDGLRLQAVIARVASPWFEAVALSNTRNRRVVRGRGPQAAAADQVFVDVKAGTRLRAGADAVGGDPGPRRPGRRAGGPPATVPSSSSASPTTSSRPSTRLRHYAPGAGKTSTVGTSRSRSRPPTATRGSSCSAPARGTDANYGRPVTSRSGEVKDNPATADGEGLSFSAPKRLIIADHAVKSRQDAEGQPGARGTGAP